MTMIIIDVDESTTSQDVERYLMLYKKRFDFIRFRRNGEMILCSTADIAGSIEKVFGGLSHEEIETYDTIVTEQNSIEQYIEELEEFKDNNLFNWYLGQSLLYVKPDKKKEFEEKMVSVFNHSRNLLYLKLVSRLLFLLDDYVNCKTRENSKDILRELSILFGELKNDEWEQSQLKCAIACVHEYGIYGKEVDSMIFGGTVSDIIKREKVVIEDKGKELKKLRDKMNK